MLLSIPSGLHIWGVNNDRRSNAAHAQLSAPTPADAYNRNYLKSPNKYVTPVPTPSDPTSMKYWAFARGADDRGCTTASAPNSKASTPSMYNANYLKSPNTYKSPIPVPYSKKNALLQLKDGGLDSDSAEDTKVDYLAIARLIFSTLDKTDPIKKKYWNDIIDKLQRLALIKQIRPLNPEPKPR
jgi:hypothetical protein